MRFTEAGRPSVSVVLGSEAGRVERTAAQIVVDEVRERNGVALPVVSEREAGSLAGGLVVLETPSTNRLIGDADVRPEGDERGETIAVRTADVQGRRATRASTRSTTSCSTSARLDSARPYRRTSTAPPSSCSCAARRRRR